MKAVSSKINHFTVVDELGKVDGNYYLDQLGNIVVFPKQFIPNKVQLPYIVSVDIESMDDVCTLHISEIEEMIEKLKNNIDCVRDEKLKLKYIGYIEALNYVVSHNSYIDPWPDFIHKIERGVNID